MSTYLELFNSAVLESGTDMDALDGTAFDALSSTAGDRMSYRFKKWVQQAWKEVQMERNEWEFKTKQAQIIIYPRVLVIDGDRSAAPPVGAEYEGDTTGATFTVVAVSDPTLSGAWADGDAVAWIDFSDLDGNFMFNEEYDEVSPDVTKVNAFRIKWFGRYDLHTEVTDLLEPNLSTFSIQYPAGISTTLDENSPEVLRLQYVPWDQWVIAMENQQTYDQPSFFTTTPEGYYDFYPRPNGPYIVTFQYTAEPQNLSVAADSVTALPSDYQDMIMWRAVMYYADYDSKPSTFARAERRYEYYKNRVEKNQMPTIGFGPNRYAMTRV